MSARADRLISSVTQVREHVDNNQLAAAACSEGHQCWRVTVRSFSKEEKSFG